MRNDSTFLDTICKKYIGHVGYNPFKEFGIGIKDRGRHFVLKCSHLRF